MRYLVTARVKPGREAALLKAIEDGTLGAGSVAGDEYLGNMSEARLCQNGNVRWVECCFCDVPLDEERPYWEEFFDFVRIQEYQDLFFERLRDARVLEERPCPGGERVARWYLCNP